MLKKMMLLAMSVGALVAFAAPAVAQAEDKWYTHTEGTLHEVGSTTLTGDTVEFTGKLASTAGALKSGDCEVHVKVIVWNPVGGTATGEVTSVVITGPCPVTAGGNPLPGCSLESASSNTEKPWHFNTLPGTLIDIENANFRNVYSAGCGAFGIPAEVEAAGTLTGEGVNRAEPARACIVFNSSGHMKNVATEAAVTVDGEVCAPDLTLQ